MEESTLAHLTPHEQLSDVFAWYSLLGTAGTALGQLICGWVISSLQSLHGWAFVPSCRIIFFVYAAVGVIKLLLTFALSSDVEVTPIREQQKPQNSETSPLLAGSHAAQQGQEVEAVPTKKSLWSSLDRDLTSLIIRLFILFGLDAFASGLASL